MVITNYFDSDFDDVYRNVSRKYQFRAATILAE